MSRFLNPKFRGLEAYTPGEQPQDQVYIKLNTNESPYPPSPEVFQAVTPNEIEKLRLYPDPEGKVLKEKIAKLYGTESKNIFLSNGSDDILNFAFMAFCENEKGVAYPEISYGFYPVYSDLYQLKRHEILLKDDFSIDYKAYCNIQKTIVIANPNAPTGIALSSLEIEEILKSNPNELILIDEAYVDFGGESVVALVQKYSNLLVSMTFSKSRSLAGARLGFAIAHEEIIADLEKIKFSTNPYNINRLTLAIGEKAIDSHEYYKENARKIIETRQKVVQILEKMNFRILDSKANFIFISHVEFSGETIYRELKKKGILVRHFKKEKIENFLRVTIGTPEEMDCFIEKIKEILE